MLGRYSMRGLGADTPAAAPASGGWGGFGSTLLNMFAGFKGAEMQNKAALEQAKIAAKAEQYRAMAAQSSAFGSQTGTMQKLVPWLAIGGGGLLVVALTWKFMKGRKKGRR